MEKQSKISLNLILAGLFGWLLLANGCGKPAGSDKVATKGTALGDKTGGEPCEDCVSPGSRSALLLAAAKNQQSKAVPVNIADPIIEKAIREELKKQRRQLDFAQSGERALHALQSLNRDLKDRNESSAQIDGVIEKTTGELTKADLEKVVNLDLQDNQLTDLTGVENLTQLRHLNLNRNQLTSVMGLENLTQLRTLSLNDNQLTELPKGLEKLNRLTWLGLNFNQLTDLKPLGNLTQLEELWLAGNQLTDVKGLENLTQLTVLNLDGNKLADVTGLEKLPKLEMLRLPNSQLTKLPKGLEKLMQLRALNLWLNQLTDVKGLEKLTQLEELVLADNPDLTKAQIAELQKALPKCKIGSNPTE